MSGELDAERDRVIAKRVVRVREGRAVRLLAERRPDETLEERLRLTWPKLNEDEARATLERAREIEADPARRGRRIEGDELEELRKQMTTKTTMTPDRAREYARKRIEEAPSVTGAQVHRELQKKGYEPGYQTFYSQVWKKAQASTNGKAAPASAEEPRTAEAVPPASADPGDDESQTRKAPSAAPPARDAESARTPTTEPPAGEVALKPIIEVESIHANVETDRKGEDYCNISLVISAPADFINRIGDVLTALRRVA